MLIPFYLMSFVVGLLLFFVGDFFLALNSNMTEITFWIPVIVFFFACSFLYPLINFLWKGIFRKALSSFKYFLIFFAFLGVLFFFNKAQLQGKESVQALKSDYGQCSYLFSFYLLKDGTQKKWESFFSSKGALLNKLSSETENFCKSQKLTASFLAPKAPSYCQIKESRYECYDRFREAYFHSKSISSKEYKTFQKNGKKIVLKKLSALSFDSSFDEKSKSHLKKFLVFEKNIQKYRYALSKATHAHSKAEIEEILNSELKDELDFSNPFELLNKDSVFSLVKNIFKQVKNLAVSSLKDSEQEESLSLNPFRNLNRSIQSDVAELTSLEDSSLEKVERELKASMLTILSALKQ